jgi:hypothetical protein
MPVEFHLHDGAATRKAKELHFHDGTAARKAKEAWYHDGAAARKVFSGFAVSVIARSSGTDGNLMARVYFNSDGTAAYNTGSGTQQAATTSWGTPTTAGEGANYWIRFTYSIGTGSVTVEGGALAEGASTGWLNLANQIDIAMASGPLNSERDAACSYSIASDAAGANIIGTAALNLFNVNGSPP